MRPLSLGDLSMLTPAVELIDLCKTYKNNLQAVKNIHLTVNQGDFFALLGPNGAGKSTIINMICSLATISSGQIKIMGDDLSTHPSIAKQHLGIMPQEVNLNIFETPWNTLIQQAAYYGIKRHMAKQRAEYLLKQVDLWNKKSTTVRTLSGGMKRRLMIARALIHDPKVLILDEPTAGVDIEIRNDIWKFLQTQNNNGLTIILTTHYLEEAENLCHRIGIIKHGEVVRQTLMSTLLQELDTETIILYLKEPHNHTIQLEHFCIRQMNPLTLEVDVNKQQTIAALFAALAQQNILVDRMRNKHNRLEQTFINLVAAQ